MGQRFSTTCMSTWGDFGSKESARYAVHGFNGIAWDWAKGSPGIFNLPLNA